MMHGQKNIKLSSFMFQLLAHYKNRIHSKISFLNVIFKFNIYPFSFGFHIKSEIKQPRSECSKQSYTELEKPR